MIIMKNEKATLYIGVQLLMKLLIFESSFLFKNQLYFGNPLRDTKQWNKLVFSNLLN